MYIQEVIEDNEEYNSQRFAVRSINNLRKYICLYCIAKPVDNN